MAYNDNPHMFVIHDVFARLGSAKCDRIDGWVTDCRRRISAPGGFLKRARVSDIMASRIKTTHVPIRRTCAERIRAAFLL